MILNLFQFFFAFTNLISLHNSNIKKDSNQHDMMEINNEDTQVQFAIKAVSHIVTIQKKIKDMIKNGKSSEYNFDDLSKECDHIINAIYLMKNESLDNFEDDNDNVIVNLDILETLMNKKLDI